jgi:hypothetical protein
VYRLILIPLLCTWIAAPAWSQENDDEPAIEATAEEGAADEADVKAEPEPEPEPDFDETGLDEQGFADEDDDFDPTEEIPSDQSIEFPTDI